MAKTKNNKVKKLERQERVQRKELNMMARQERWLRWAVIAIIILLLLLLLGIGYATNWFQGDKRDAVNQTPTSGQLTDQNSATGATGNTTGSASERSTTTNGGTTTRETNTSTNTTTTTNNNTTTPSPSQPLIDLSNLLNTGDNINDIKELADSLGIVYECDILLILAVEECRFGVGDTIITTRSLTLNDLITSIDDNF